MSKADHIPDWYGMISPLVGPLDPALIINQQSTFSWSHMLHMHIPYAWFRDSWSSWFQKPCMLPQKKEASGSRVPVTVCP